MKGIQLIEFPATGVSSAAPFNFRPFFSQCPLSKSIASHGGNRRSGKTRDDLEKDTPGVLKASPLLLLQTASTPVIVDGHRRMAAAHRAGVPTVPAFLLPENTAREVVVFKALSGRASGLSDVERLIAVRKTSHYVRHGVCGPDAGDSAFVSDQLIPLYSRFFSREVSGELLNRLLDVLEFPGEELALLHILDVPADHLASLLDLNARERRGLLLLRSRIPITASETGKLIRLFLFLRGPVSQNRFDLERWIVEKISSYDSRARGKDLIAELHKLSHPTLTRREEAIDAAIRSLRFPPSITLRPPENLEGDAFSCYFRFSSVEEVEEHLRRIQSAIETGTLRKLLGELNDS